MASLNQLPPKENTLFKQIVKHYEQKQYKKGLKAAEQILKKFPDHGETLAMKGLTLNCLDKKQEAYDYVQRGLKNDLKSHVCWHVYGLLYRSDRDYLQAIKCYRNALRIDTENLQILRDLSLLQVQMRDLKGFTETRRQLLTLKPNNRSNWIGFALSHHLEKNYELAKLVLGQYEETLTAEDQDPYEHSEMLLYKLMVMEESGDLKACLEEADKGESAIVDKLALKELRARCHEELGNTKEAEEAYRALLKINGENYDYHRGLQRVLGVELGKEEEADKKKRKQLFDVYAELREQQPRVAATRRLQINFADGNDFRRVVGEYLEKKIRSCVPSLFSDLKALYQYPAKSEMIEEIMVGYLASLRKDSVFSAPKGNEKVTSEGPTALLWALMFLAQHYDKLGQLDKALTFIDEAIEHTPTLIDLYRVKGRILKHFGDLDGAFEQMDKARQMDLADRYLNTKSTLYALRAGRVNAAETTISHFTKDGEQNNLFDMQCMWYEMEAGRAHVRREEHGKALRKFSDIIEHFTDITEDQFDFHTYCLRKMTLRPYVKMLRFEDSLHSHKYFVTAATSMVRIYLHLYDNPKSDEEKNEEDEFAGMSEAEKKKARNKKRREELRKQKESEASGSQQTKQEEKKPADTSSGASKRKKERDDVDGKLLLEDPLLESAVKYVNYLNEHCSDRLETHILTAEVHMRRAKYAIALRGLLRAHTIDPESSELGAALVRFSALVSADKSVDEKAKAVVINCAKPVVDVTNPKKILESVVSKAGSSFEHCLAAASSTLIVNANDKSKCCDILNKYTGNDVSWSKADNVATFLKQKVGAKEASAWRTKYRTKFPKCPLLEDKYTIDDAATDAKTEE